jgi:imidazolonepropionase-like amidohydrolase
VHRELELLQKAGIPAAALTRIATLNGAIFLGRAQQSGSIEVGKDADAVLLSKDPTRDIRNAREIEQVMKGGVVIDREALPLAGR